MATLQNTHGGSLVPDTSPLNNLLLQTFGTRQQRDQKAQEQELLQDITGTGIAADQPGIDIPAGAIDESGATGNSKKRQAALMRLAAINPQLAKNMQEMTLANDKQAMEAAKMEAENGLKRAVYLNKLPNYEAKRNGLIQLAQEDAAQGKDVNRYVDLINMEPEQLDNELLKMQVMGRDISTLTETPELKEIKTRDADGNEVIQTVRIDPITGQQSEVASADRFESELLTPEEEAQKARIARAGGTQVNQTVEGDNRPQVGTIPPGFQLSQNEDGAYVMDRIPGGPAEAEEEDRQRELETQRGAQATIAGFTLRDASAIQSNIDNMNPIGVVRKSLASIPGTDEYEVEKDIDSLKGTISIEQLLNIKRQGAGLGQVPQAQLDLLARLMGELDIGRRRDRLKTLVKDIQQRYVEILDQIPEEERELVGIADREYNTLKKLWDGDQEEEDISKMSDDDLLKGF